MQANHTVAILWSAAGCGGPGLEDTGEMKYPYTASFVCAPIYLTTYGWATRDATNLAPAITRGSVVFDAFCGLWSREKATLSHRSHAKHQ
jgi:hypothetical protein